MKLITKELEQLFSKYPFHSQENRGGDARVLVKYFNPTGVGTWYITEAEKKSNIRYDELANLVLDAINKKIQKFYDEIELENLDSKKKENRFNKRIISLEKQRDDINNKISKTRYYLRNLYEDKVNGVVTGEQFKDLITNYNNDEDTYKDQIKSINNEIAY